MAVEQKFLMAMTQSEAAWIVAALKSWGPWVSGPEQKPFDELFAKLERLAEKER